VFFQCNDAHPHIIHALEVLSRSPGE
jgi:hypothetical protein